MDRTQPDRTFHEFFAGIGLVRCGLEAAGWRCVYANDNDPKKREMYQARFGPSPEYRLADIRRVDDILSGLPGGATLATASFPCVDLSVAGHYKGLAGAESSTFFAFTEVLRRLGPGRPRIVLLENVAGFLTANGGEDFSTAVRELAGLGYWIDALLIDAAHFTPQSRPRVFVVGVAADSVPGAAKRLSRDWFGSTPNPSAVRPAAVVRALGRSSPATGWARLHVPALPERTLQLDDVIDQGDDQDWWAEDDTRRHVAMMSDAHRRQVTAIQAAGRRWVGTVFRRVRQGVMRAEVRFDGLAGCLRTPRGGSANQIVVACGPAGLRMRWMTPREYARLQGVPDFPLVGGRVRQLWGLADAVCAPAVTWLAENVLRPCVRGRPEGRV